MSVNCRAGHRRQPRPGPRARASSWRAPGARVVLVARESEELRRGGRGDPRRRRRSAHAIAADVGDKRGDPRHRRRRRRRWSARSICWSTTPARWGRRRCALLLDTDCEDLERVLAVNLVGPFRLTKAIAGAMVAARARHDRARHARTRRSRPTSAGAPTACRRRRSTSSARIWAAELGGHRRARCSASTPARWTRACTPTRCPTPIRATLARSGRGRRADRRAARRRPSAPERASVRSRRRAARGRRRRDGPATDVRGARATTCACCCIDPRARRRSARRAARRLCRALLRAGDLLVVNDAATLPASLPARRRRARGRGAPRARARRRAPLARGAVRRRRLAHAHRASRAARRRWPPARASRFGRAGADGRRASRPSSPRLVELRFDADGDALWAALYRAGRPDPVRAPGARRWRSGRCRRVYAARPWAVEMPSAGRAARSWETAARRCAARGVALAALTHAAGLSATGDPALDAALPLPERYEIPAATVRARSTRRARRGGRVVAVGTTRRARARGRGGATATLRAAAGETDLRHRRRLSAARRRRHAHRAARAAARATSRCCRRSPRAQLERRLRARRARRLSSATSSGMRA